MSMFYDSATDEVVVRKIYMNEQDLRLGVRPPREEVSEERWTSQRVIASLKELIKTRRELLYEDPLANDDRTRHLLRVYKRQEEEYSDMLELFPKSTPVEARN